MCPFHVHPEDEVGVSMIAIYVADSCDCWYPLSNVLDVTRQSCMQSHFPIPRIYQSCMQNYWLSFNLSTHHLSLALVYFGVFILLAHAFVSIIPTVSLLLLSLSLFLFFLFCIIHHGHGAAATQFITLTPLSTPEHPSTDVHGCLLYAFAPSPTCTRLRCPFTLIPYSFCNNWPPLVIKSLCRI